MEMPEPKIGDLIRVTSGAHFGKQGVVVHYYTDLDHGAYAQRPVLVCRPKLTFGKDTIKDAVEFEVLSDCCIVVKEAGK